MSHGKPPESARQSQIITGDETARERDSNNMAVSYSSEESNIEWLLNSPSGTHLVSRIIVSPGHMKRIIGALSDNLRKDEAQFGTVTAIESKEQAFR